MQEIGSALGFLSFLPVTRTSGMAVKKALLRLSLSAGFDCGTAPVARATIEASTAGICKSQFKFLIQCLLIIAGLDKFVGQ